MLIPRPDGYVLDNPRKPPVGACADARRSASLRGHHERQATMATPLQVHPTYTTFASNHGKVWRATPHGQQAVMMRADAVGGPGRPALSRGRYRDVIALVVTGDAVSLDIDIVRQVFGPRAVAESDVA